MAITLFASSYVNSLNAISRLDINETLEKNLQFSRRQILEISDRTKVEAGGDIKLFEEEAINWTAEIESTHILDLFKLSITYNLADKALNETSELSDTHYVLRPEWSDPNKRSQLLSERQLHLDKLKNR